MNINDKRFLVTGGAGLIGSHIADLLLRRGAGRVVILDNLLRGDLTNMSAAVQDPRVEFINGDIRDRDLVRSLLQRTDGLFHMAALRIKHCIQEPRTAIDVMFSASLDMLLMAAELEITRTVAASSSSIYGQADTFPTTEDHHPYHDTTLYGAAKLGAEGALRAFRATHGLSYATLRFFNVYGPRMDIHGLYTEVLVRWMERIEAGQPPLIFGDGSDSMDFTYGGDAARACVLAMENDAHSGVYNVGTGVSTDLVALSRLLLKVMGSDLQPDFRPADAQNAVRYRLAGTEKAAAEIGFRAEVSLEQGLRELVAWWRSQKTKVAA